MKYLLLMYGTEGLWNDDERRDCMVESLAVCDELTARGQFIATAPLQPVATAATVRVREGRPLVTDGPFAETTEQLGGYFLLDLPDLDAAIAVAARLPSVRMGKGAAEIRPLLALDVMPPSKSHSAGSNEPGHTPYLLLCYHSEAVWEKIGATAQREAMIEAAAVCRRLSDEGKYLNSSPLHPAATATCVRMRNGKREITDGPFAETHEVLGGFYVILAESRDEAVRTAARQPGARFGSIEVRPLFDFSGLHNSISIS